MDTKSALLKYKSSNNGMPSKTKNKKSISDGNITPKLVKKRGMYVDRKLYNIPQFPQEADNFQVRRKPPPRPKLGQKKFLDSVLTILSKVTTGTQYPDVPENIKDDRLKARSRSRQLTDARTEKGKHRKYKSRILNRHMKKDDDEFIILQSMKDITQTSSNYINTNTVNDAQNDRQTVKSIRDVLANTINNEVTSVAREVLEGITGKREKKIKINDEPETLVSKTAKDVNLHNLFVDILQNTFNNYNLKDVLSESNTALEIDESIAKKLAINNEIDSNELRKHTTKEISLKLKEQQPTDTKLSNTKPLKREPKIIIKPFVNNKVIDIRETYNFKSNRKTFKNIKKRNILNIFKEQLQINSQNEEPINLYQALKVMVRNKKKCENRIHFQRPNKNFDKSECMYRRKLISKKLDKKAKTFDSEKIVRKHSEYSRTKKRENYVVPSYHSLKIYSYNYEPQKPKRVHHKPVLEYSPPPVRSSNLDYYALLKFPDCSSCDFNY